MPMAGRAKASTFVIELPMQQRLEEVQKTA